MIPVSKEPSSQLINSRGELDFDRLFKELYTPLCRFSMKFVMDKEAAEDIVQEVFVYFWENRKRLAAISLVKSYAFTAVKHRSLSYLQSHFLSIKAENCFDSQEAFLLSELPGPEELLESKELDTIIEKALETLPVKCRSIFALKRFGELSNKEIADKLNISVKTVENQMTIALKKLTRFISMRW